MLTFNKNKKKTLRCKVEIEGADYTKVRPRLVLSPTGDNKHIFFEGTFEKGMVQVIIPEGLDIAHSGNAVLEVLVDNTMFTPLTTTYKMIVESVKVTDVTITKNENKVKLTEEAVIEEKKPIVTLKKTQLTILREGLPESQKKRIEEYVNSYKKLSSKDRKFLREYILPKFKPSENVQKWGNAVFKETKSLIPRVCMYAIESKKK